MPTVPTMAQMTVVYRYDEVREVLMSSRFRQASKQESEPFVGSTLLTLDGEEHRQRRRLEAALVHRDVLRRHETDVLVPTIEATLAEAMAPGGSAPEAGAGRFVDLVVLARTVFLRLAAATIGLDDVDRPGRTERLFELLQPLLEGVTVEWSTRPHDVVVAKGQAAMDALDREFVAPSLERRHRAGGTAARDVHDLLGILLDAGWDPSTDHVALLRETVLYLAASTLNNAALTTHAVHEVTQWCVAHPAADRRLGDHDFLADVVHETLRLHVPSPALVRQALEAVVLASGRRVRPGELLALDLAGANRDPEVFGADAEEFRLGRDEPLVGSGYGLVFGAGVHRCLGQPLVLGTYAQDGDTEGMVIRLLQALFAAGIGPHPERSPRVADTAQERHATYPVVFRGHA